MTPEWIDKQLAKFKSDSVKFMRDPPKKFDASGNIVDEAETLFLRQSNNPGDFIDYRNRFRTSAFGEETRVYSAYDRTAWPEVILGKKYHKTPQTIEAACLKQSSLAETPWSGSYWPVYRGQLAWRYGDEDFPDAENWRENYKYYLDNPPSPGNFNTLSPAEKYDLLVRDGSFNLTEYMWSQCMRHKNADDSVPPWVGICDGWAYASYTMARPMLSVDTTVRLPDGYEINLVFFPSDIKALASQLWAPTSHLDGVKQFIGTTCVESNPKTDTTGRLIANSSRDPSAGTWHLVITNHIGLKQRSFVMDATYDSEVWNHPIHGYKFEYFNPLELLHKSQINEAKVDIKKFYPDKFWQYRSGLARSVLGIAMEVAYIIETTPDHLGDDDPSNDVIRKVRYFYDIELDEDDKIIGGEWYQNCHPDFLWTFPPGSRPDPNSNVKVAGMWDKQLDEIPQPWRLPAQTASRQGLPLAEVVAGLIKFANRSQP